MSLRHPLAAVLATLAATGLAACGDDDGGGGGTGAPISVQVFGDPEELRVFRKVVAAYQRSSGTRVRLLEVGDRKDHLAKLVAAGAARRMPDAFLLNHRLIGPFAAKRVLDPVGPRLGDAADDFYRVALDAYRIDGVVQCLPQNVSSLVVYVNTDLFRRAGVAVPRDGWRYAEFLDAARRLQRRTRYAVAVDPTILRVAPFVWGAGGELVDDVDEPTRFTLDTPAARRGMQALVDLRRTGLAPGRKEATALAPEERFVEGELPMFLSSRREVPTLRAIRDFAWDVVPFPVLERPASVLHSDGLCVGAGPRRDAAHRFVRFALGPEGQRILARGGRIVPSLKAVAESPDFLESTPPANARAFLDQIRVMRRVPTTENWSRVEEIVDLALAEAYFGGLSLDEAIGRIERETQGRF